MRDWTDLSTCIIGRQWSDMPQNIMADALMPLGRARCECNPIETQGRESKGDLPFGDRVVFSDARA
jgi:hypothetical protein